MNQRLQDYAKARNKLDASRQEGEEVLAEMGKTEEARAHQAKILAQLEAGSWKAFWKDWYLYKHTLNQFQNIYLHFISMYSISILS